MLAMSENVHKYENWRAITESDYVTMFIKTWFAFVATLRELYPKENLEDIIGKGDKAFLNPYLDDYENKYCQYNDVNKSKEDILKVYQLGRIYTLENEKYNRFFAEDFYEVNKLYSWSNSKDGYECSIKYSSDYIISIHAKYTDDILKIDGKPLIISEKIDISDLVLSKNLSKENALRFIEDEAAYIEYVSQEISNRVSLVFVGKITDGDYNLKFSSDEALARLNALTLSINNEYISTLALMKDPTIQRENLLFSQTPCANFIYRVEDGAEIPNIATYKWFLNFVYFMRNALFHEIIDPLDSFWQEIFKHSYLALKEILDGNINFFIERSHVKSFLTAAAWDEILYKKAFYVPNFNENYDNGDLVINFKKYNVDDTKIYFNSELNLNYWFDDHTLKQMVAVCKGEFNRNTVQIENFKMELIRHDDI